MIYIGFDYSLNKPAGCILKNGKYSFKFWPLELDNKSLEKLQIANIYIKNRQRISPGTNSSEKFRVHIKMAGDLSDIIINDIKKIIKNETVTIGFEGASFNSGGNSGLQLEGYKYILVEKLGKLYGLENIFIFAPNSIKSVAGCATKDKRGKDSMIKAFAEKDINHKFREILKNDPMLLKKKTNFVAGVDDIVDSYFVIETLRNKEGI